MDSCKQIIRLPKLCVLELLNTGTVTQLVFWSLQDWWLDSHRVFLLFWISVPREARWAPQLALHVLDDWGNIRICHGLGYNPTLWWVQSPYPYSWPYPWIYEFMVSFATIQASGSSSFDLQQNLTAIVQHFGEYTYLLLAESYMRRTIPLSYLSISRL